MSFFSSADNPATSLEEGAARSANAVVDQTYYFPPEMIGGSCPLVKGEEESLAWNAAAESCDSERVHFVWRQQEDRIWYLAIRSADLASHVGTWCPFASLLPGMPDARPSPVIYTYYSDETATLMAVDRDTLQIIRGTTSVVRAKAERLSREWANAEIVDLIPSTIAAFKANLWESLSLREDRARRFFALLSVSSAMLVVLISAFIWFSAALVQMHYKTDLRELQDRTSRALLELQQTAMTLRTSDMREQIAKFITLNEALVGMQGWLKYYSITGTSAAKPGATPTVKWWAVVPGNLTSDRIQDVGAQTLENTPDGLVIANSKDSVIHKGGGH